MEHDSLEDDLGSAQAEREVNLRVGGRPVSNSTSDLGQYQLTADPASTFKEVPGLRRLSLFDDEFEES
jgi:hypothetical protein